MSVINIPNRFLSVIAFIALAFSVLSLVGCAGIGFSEKYSVEIFEPLKSKSRADLSVAKGTCRANTAKQMAPILAAQSKAQAEYAQAQAIEQLADSLSNSETGSLAQFVDDVDRQNANRNAQVTFRQMQESALRSERNFFSACMLDKGWRSRGVLAFNDVNAHLPVLADGWSPLFSAAVNDNTDTVNWLISLGANVNAKDASGNTPLYWAVNQGRFKSAQVLIYNGADVNAEDQWGASPLHEAAVKDNFNIAELLIKSGTDVNSEIPEGHTALHTAAKFNAFRVADLLLSKGANTEIQAGADGFTPLHQAAFYGSAGVADLLIGRGANREAKSYAGETPLDVAKRLQKRDVIDVLESESSGQRFTRVGCFNIIGSDPDITARINGVEMTLKVDTGADITHLTNQQALAAKVQKAGKSTFTLADGSSVVNDVDYAYISLGRELTAKFPVSIGDGNGLLGRNVLDQFACQ